MQNAPLWQKRGLALFGMARPMQLLAVTLVYGWGLGMARAEHHATLSATAIGAGYVVLILLSMSIHYANEYADYATDAYTQRTPFSGGSGALVRTGLSPKIGLLAAQITLILGLGLGVGVWALGWLPSVALGIGILGVFFGWMYSLPPLQLAWRGWGEVDNALLGGVALPLYGYAVHSGTLNLKVVVACVPFAMLVFINLLATTWADREADAHVGKYTLATRWSVARLRQVYISVAASAFGLLFWLAGRVMPSAISTYSLAALPLVVWGAVVYTRWRNPFPTVAAMIVLLLVQLVGWWAR